MESAGWDLCGSLIPSDPIGKWLMRAQHLPLVGNQSILKTLLERLNFDTRCAFISGHFQADRI